jgi:hypothetical protein
MLAAVARPAGDPTADPVVRAAVQALLRVCDWVESASLTTTGETDQRQGPASLLVAGRATDDELRAVVRRLAGDRVLARLLPGGLRVKNVASQLVADTPGRCYP